MTFAPGTRVAHRDYPEIRGTVVAPADGGWATATGETISDSVYVRRDGEGEVPLPYYPYMWLPIKNTLVTIGCTGNRIAYLNVSVEEATRRFLARENEHVYGDDQKKTELDSCDRVSVLEFGDEFPTYE
jgi:hypothetical protein